MKRQIILATLSLFYWLQEEKDIDPLVALTEKNTAALRNTEWYGLYRNKGEDAYGNYSGYRGYAIAFGNDSSFTFYGAGLQLNGFWTVRGDTSRFRFATGAQNRWSCVIQGDSLFSNFIQPLPDNFSFDRNLKKIPSPPIDVIGHTWTENSMSAGRFSLVFTDKTAGMGYPTTSQMKYTTPR